MVHPVFGYQCKLRRGPDYILDWLRGICATAQANNRIGVVIWKQPGHRDDEALVVLRLKDWTDLHGAVPQADGVDGGALGDGDE